MYIESASCDALGQDLIDKLHALNEVYCVMKSTQQIITIVDKNINSSKVLSPFVKRNKTKPLTLRKKCDFEKVYKQMIKKITYKGKTQKVPSTCILTMLDIMLLFEF